MEKLLFIITLCFSSFYLKAQSGIDFLGIQVCGADTVSYISALKEKGYKYISRDEGCILFSGFFAGMEATVLLVPFEGSEKINGIMLSIDNLNPVKMGSLYSELLQKYLKKYQNMEYDTHVDPNGSVTTTFHDDSGFVALKTNIADMGQTCCISIIYSCNNTSTDNSYGIGMDDI